MEANKDRPAWMYDEKVQHLDPRKLDFLQELFNKGHGKSQKEMMSALMPLIRRAKQEHLALSPQEMQAAIEAIKRHSTEEELQKIENILSKNQKQNT